MFGKEGLMDLPSENVYRQYNVRLTSADGSADNNAYISWETGKWGLDYDFGIFYDCEKSEYTKECFYLYRNEDGSFRC